MLLGKAIIVFVLGSITAAAAQVRPLKPASAPQSSVATTSRSDQLAALRDDISKMRVLVQQMESNLAFVDTTQSPLKHQFQLEIDMWKTLIKQMERRLDAAEPR
jgi:TolA-binding protein